ncbi:hypothetical protein CI109_107062 [Kwoniella shandongensis]|uniref:D-serine dehydratase n=1 Tax=Kwoniella shandongensis TaxID=1734106 RepID=A0A5M6BT63_9TREE|nr:uncharacterized protein CI109_006471 [Kwoniella shandongensis]KAA5525202.1 hypothetical protein CI109_006471 [Kwoniella shandongensis]
MSTFTPLSLYSLPSKSALVDQFVGQPISSLRTPALIVDRTKFKNNCEKVTGEAKKRGMNFRVHVKTHKTIEGTRMQVEAAGGAKATITSTMVELWQIIEGGLVEEGLVDDILYSMPVSADKMEDLNSAQEKIGSKGTIRLMVDHPKQIEELGKFNDRVGRKEKWSVFVKVDGGGRRAGVPPTSQQMKDIIGAIVASKHVEIYGFYSHFGQSYASDSLSKGSSYFAGEIDCVQSAAKIARSLGAEGKWVLSVGATPTAHAAVREVVQSHGGLEGELELHAGCYCMCDLQQHATSLITTSNLAITVLARVVSTYPHRDEAMCDAGALAVSKDTGRYPGFGRVVSPPKARGWDLGRISQEHGTLVKRPQGDETEFSENLDGEGGPEIGDLVEIVPQHACLVCANFPWFYVVEDGRKEVVDVWVPWRGW